MQRTRSWTSQLGSRHLLLMMENLDRAFRGLGDTGQKKWRAFLQETGRVAALATSQQLFEGISRDEAFFGFFDIRHLGPLSVEHAQRLIANVAHGYGNEELATFLGTSEGRYRVRALRHVAGGNRRMYIVPKHTTGWGSPSWRWPTALPWLRCRTRQQISAQKRCSSCQNQWS